MEKIEELIQELGMERARSERYKALLDKANSEAAHCKRVLKDYQADEQKRTEREKKREEEIFRLNRELEAIRASKQFAEMGMREDVAIKTARAFLDGDSDKFHSNIALHIEEIKKKEQEKAIEKFLAENHMEVYAGCGDSGSSSAENIALKHVRNIKVNENDLKNFK